MSVVVQDLDLSSVVWSTDKSSLKMLLDYAIPSSSVVTFDLETTGLDEHAVTNGRSNGGVAARVVLLSMTLDHDDRSTTYVVPLSHPQSPLLGSWRSVLRLLARRMVGKRLVGHNVKFDCRWIHAMTGVDLSGSIWWDTMLSAHLLNENESKKLKEVAPRIFGVDRWDDVALNRPGAAEFADLFQLGEYAARDTYWTWRLYEHHYSWLVDQWRHEAPMFPEDVDQARLGDLAVHVTMPTSRTLCAIEQRGLRLDQEWVTIQLEKLQDRRTALFTELVNKYTPEDYEAASIAPAASEDASFAPTSHWFKAWVEVAVHKGDLRVTALTPTGQSQWSKSVLSRQAREGSDTALALLALRDVTKKSEFLRSWLDKVSPDGRIHATYNVGSVVTGRLSSSDPNLQQVTHTLRPAFIPTEGHYLAEIDFSQIELRVAAFISRCAPMIEAFRRGDDLHTMLASRITGKDAPDVTKDDRQAGKSANFGLLYGMGATGFREYAEDAYGVILTDDEAATIHAAFFDLWEGLREWHIASENLLRRNGQVVSPIGRIRRLYELYSQDEFRGIRAAINSPVQGFASDIMQIAAHLIETTVPEAALVGTVHDSIMVEVPAHNWREVTDACVEVMERGVLDVLEKLGCRFDVPLVAEASVGTRWGWSDVSDSDESVGASV